MDAKANFGYVLQLILSPYRGKKRGTANKAVTASRTRGALAGSRDDLDSPTGVVPNTDGSNTTSTASASRYANYSARTRDRNGKGGSQAQDILARIQDKPSGTVL